MTTMGEIVEAHAIVSGHVQGVCFRAATVEAAAKAGVRGWVRNLPGRQVEAVLQGEHAAVEKVLDFLRTGPPRAHVVDVAVSWRAPGERYNGFDVRY